MGLKKGYCVYCDAQDKREHIIDVNPDAKVFFCPKCLHPLDPKDAIREYQKYIAKLLSKADLTLNRYSEFYNAYQSFAYILEIEPNNFKARIGRVISLLYLSKVRTSQITNALTIFKNEKCKYYHKNEKYDQYFGYLTIINHILDEYHKKLYKRLTLKRRFYDAECIITYFLRNKELVSFKEEILDEIQFLKDKVSQSMKLEEFEEKIVKQLEKFNNEIKSSYTSAQGYKYTLIDYDKNGIPLFAKSEDKVAKSIYRIRYSSLDKEEKGKKVIINDVIFLDCAKINNFLKIVLPLYIVFFALMIIFSILSGASGGVGRDSWLIYMSLAILFALLGISFLIVRIVLKQKAKIKN